jgi:hypothetical protein
MSKIDLGLAHMRYRLVLIFGAIAAIQLFLLLALLPSKNVSSANAAQLSLFQAVMCEEIFANAPRNPTIVFSINQKKAVCYSSFDQVPQKEIIYHNWYHRENEKMLDPSRLFFLLVQEKELHPLAKPHR